MKYRIYNKTTANIEPKSYQYYDEAVNACHRAMHLSPEEDFAILNEREV